MNQQHDLTPAMENVRRAYRVVAAYQRRTFSTIKLIEAKFPEVGFYYWTPRLYKQPPQRASSPVDRWGWDGLPFYDFSILYTERELDDGYRPLRGRWMLDVHVQSDSGYDDETSGEPNGETFDAAEDSETNLSLTAWRCDGDQFSNRNWYSVWKDVDWPEESDVATDVGGGFTSLRSVRDVADLPDRAAVETFVDGFRELCRSELRLDLADD